MDILNLKLNPEQVQMTLEECKTIENTLAAFLNDQVPHLGLEYNSWTYSKQEHIGILLGIFVFEGLIKDSEGINKLCIYVTTIYDNHLDNPYHCCFHAVDVAFMTWYFMDELGILEQIYVSKLDIAAILLAALAHDVLHPGRNNNFQIATKSAVAALYENVSVLENQSSTFARELIQRLDLVRYLDLEDSSPLEIRTERINKVIHECILKTDMSHHFDLLDILSFMAHRISSTNSLSHNNVASRDTSRTSRTSISRGSISRASISTGDQANAISVAKQGASSLATGDLVARNVSMASLPSINMPDTDSRQDLLNIVLHAADISNPVRPFEITRRWAVLISEEFRQQAAQEASLSIESKLGDVSNTALSQLSFSTVILRPYFENLRDIFPRFLRVIDTLDHNVNQWERLVDDGEWLEEYSGMQPVTLGTERLRGRSISDLNQPRPMTLDFKPSRSYNDASLLMCASAGSITLPEHVATFLSKLDMSQQNDKLSVSQGIRKLSVLRSAMIFGASKNNMNNFVEEDEGPVVERGRSKSNAEQDGRNGQRNQKNQKGQTYLQIADGQSSALLLPELPTSIVIQSSSEESIRNHTKK